MVTWPVTWEWAYVCLYEYMYVWENMCMSVSITCPLWLIMEKSIGISFPCASINVHQSIQCYIYNKILNTYTKYQLRTWENVLERLHGLSNQGVTTHIVVIVDFDVHCYITKKIMMRSKCVYIYTYVLFLYSLTILLNVK